MNFKHLLSIVLVFVLSFGLCSIALADENAEIPEGYTPIYTAEDLDNIRNNLSGKYVLMNDIDLSTYENWEPIGTNTAPFAGVFDGSAFIISSLKISTESDVSGNTYYGLFGYAKNAKFNNVCIKDSAIVVKDLSNEVTRGYTGNLLGYGNNITISNSATSGFIDVSGFSYCSVGGIVGAVKMGSINCCSNYSEINAKIEPKAVQVSVGGISGVAASIEKKCSNHGGIIVNGKNISDDCAVKVGGVDGDGSENMELLNSYNTGEISVDFLTEETFIGGLSGESYATNNSYNLGKINFPNEFIGFVGAISGKINTGMIYINFAPGAKNVYYPDCISKPFGQSINLDNMINVKSLSDEEFAFQSSFAGFDFDTVWELKNTNYPTLKDEPKMCKFDSNLESTTNAEQNTVPEPTTSSDPSVTSEPEISIIDFFIEIITRVVNFLISILGYVKNILGF